MERETGAGQPPSLHMGLGSGVQARGLPKGQKQKWQRVFYRGDGADGAGCEKGKG